jgi:hypothetical protein
MIFFLIVAVSLFVALVLQQFIGPLPWLHGTRVLLMPVILFYGALVFPLWGMLVLAFLAGFMWDALTVQILFTRDVATGAAVASNVEISLGWSILLYAALGSLMIGFRPLFQRGRWEVHCLLSGLLTSVIVLAEYLMITLRRGEFIINKEIWWRIGGAGLVALVLSPFCFFFLNYIAESVGYETRPKRKKERE